MIAPDLLDQVPIFQALPTAARTAALRHGLVARYRPEQALFLAGTPADGMFVILSGEVRVVRERRGRVYVVHVEGPGGTLGEVPTIDGGPYPASAFAIQATTCLRLTRSGFRAVLAADPDAAWPFLERLASRVREVVERLDQLSTLDVTARLAKFLLHHADHARRVRIRQADLAEELGTVREVVVRVLGRMRRQRILATSRRGEVTLLDPAALRRLAAGEP